VRLVTVVYPTAVAPFGPALTYVLVPSEKPEIHAAPYVFIAVT
jgi:hypothetical protein